MHRVFTRLPKAIRSYILLMPVTFIRVLAFIYIHTVGRPSPDTENEAVIELVSKGDVVIEVGSNKGALTRTLCNIVGTRGLVLAFEPNPISYAFLLENTRGLSNVVAYNWGLWSKKGLFTFATNGPTDPGASLLDKNKPIRFKVRCTTLDIITSQVPHDIGLILVDAEGAETEIIRGAKNLLANFRVRNVIIELHPYLRPSIVKDVTLLMEDLGFTPSIFSKGNEVTVFRFARRLSYV